MKTRTHRTQAMILLLILLLLQACTGTSLITRSAVPTDVQGTYTIYLYGCKYPSDREIVVFLMNDEAPYPVEIMQPDFMYKTKKGLPAAQAMAEADTFVRCSTYSIWHPQLRAIAESSGRVIGYEVKPIFRPPEFDVAETLLTYYSIQDGTIVVRIIQNVPRDDEWGQTLRKGQ